MAFKRQHFREARRYATDSGNCLTHLSLASKALAYGLVANSLASLKEAKQVLETRRHPINELGATIDHPVIASATAALEKNKRLLKKALIALHDVSLFKEARAWATENPSTPYQEIVEDFLSTAQNRLERKITPEGGDIQDQLLAERLEKTRTGIEAIVDDHIRFRKFHEWLTERFSQKVGQTYKSDHAQNEVYAILTSHGIAPKDAAALLMLFRHPVFIYHYAISDYYPKGNKAHE